MEDGIIATIFLLIAIIIYFVPSVIAQVRGHHNSTAIYVSNLLLGWTAIGWIFVLIWAFTKVEKSEAQSNPIEIGIEADLDTKTCPYCAEQIKKNAKLCRYCGKEL